MPEREGEGMAVQIERDNVKELREACVRFMRNSSYEDAFDCICHIYKKDKETGRKMINGFRKAMKENVKEGVNVEKCMELSRKSYCLTGADNFDDFMIAIEWYREPSEKFWLPRREELLPIADALQDLEDDKLDELFLSQPPRTGKTTIVDFFLIFVMGRNANRSNLYASYSDAVAKTFYNGVLEILLDPATYDVKSVFPKMSVASTDSKDLLINIGKKRKYASLTARSLYGTLNGACDCSGYVIADDLHSGIEEATNKDLLAKAWLRVENNLLPRAKEKAKRLWIGTRWSLCDCIARRIELLETDDRFKSIRYRVLNVPALNEKDESNFNYKYNVGFSTETYLQRRASFERSNDMASWLAQYMGTPIERDGAVFSYDDLRYYNGELPKDVEPDRKYMVVDPAWGGGDFVASPVCYAYGEEIYVVDVVYSNADKTVTQPLLAQAAVKYDIQAMAVEATRTTKEYADGINNILKAKGYRLNMTTTTKHFTGTGKEQRIFDKAPEIRSRMYFLEPKYRSKEYEAFMQNVYSFTVDGKNKHDDAPDSLAMAVSFGKYAHAVVELRTISGIL